MVFVFRRAIDILLKHFQSRLELLVLFDATFHHAWLPSQLLYLGEYDLLFHIMMLLQHLKKHLAVRGQVRCVLRTRFDGKTLIAQHIELRPRSMVLWISVICCAMETKARSAGMSLFSEAPVVEMRAKGLLAHFEL
jgi:hypothetical protein